MPKINVPYEDYDDFPINQMKGGNKTRNKDNKGNINCYNSKHIRVQEAKKENSVKKKPIKN